MVEQARSVERRNRNQVEERQDEVDLDAPHHHALQRVDRGGPDTAHEHIDLAGKGEERRAGDGEHEVRDDPGGGHDQVAATEVAEVARDHGDRLRTAEGELTVGDKEQEDRHRDRIDRVDVRAAD